MTENVIVFVNYDKICRLCLQSTGGMSDLFENSGEIPLKELVYGATSLEARLDDGLPSKICHKCRHIVELSCELKTVALRSNTLLLDANNTSVIIEDTKKLTEASSEIVQPHNSIQETEISQPSLKSELYNVQPVDFNLQDRVDKERWKENYTITNTTKVSQTRCKRTPPKHLTCQICLAPFPTVEEVSTHVRTHYQHSRLTPYLELQRPYSCEICDDGMMISKLQLIIHHRRHLDVNPFECRHPGCEFVGKNKDSLRHHVIKHGARSQVCEVCGASYKRRHELKQHMSRVHRATTMYCRPCNARFRNIITYKAHLVKHQAAPRHICEWAGCSKAYYSASDLAAHSRSHSGDKTYTCHLCAAAAYTSQSLLNRHLRKHDRARVSKCDKCSATFDEYGALYRHRVTEHGPWQPHRCEACNKRFQKEENLQKHMESCAMMDNDTKSPSVQNDENVQTLLIEEIIDTDKPLHTGAILDKLRGHSLGTINHLGKDFVLQDLPADGLLYIEVDDEVTDKDKEDVEWHQ